MPGATVNRAYPYPLPADSINVPRDVQALAEAVDIDMNNRPQGLLLRNLKASQEGGFGNGIEYVISGLNIVVPATPTLRSHLVTFKIHMLVTTLGAAASQLGFNLRLGSVTGSIVDQVAWNFPASITTYPIYLPGAFIPTGLQPGATYVLTTSTDGAGRYNINAGSASMLYDVT